MYLNWLVNQRILEHFSHPPEQFLLIWVWKLLESILNHCVYIEFRLLWQSCLVAKSCPTLLWPHGLVSARPLCPCNFQGKNIGMGCHFHLQDIFPDQGSNQHLLHWHIDSLPPGKPVLWPNVESECLCHGRTIQPNFEKVQPKLYSSWIQLCLPIISSWYLM